MPFLKLLLPLALVAQAAFIITCSAEEIPSLSPAQTSSPKNYTALSVGVIVYELATPLDYIGPLQYFDKLSVVGVDVHISTIGLKAGLMRSGEDGIPYHATHSYEDLQDAKFDVLMITGGTPDAVLADPNFMAFITAQAKRADHVLSICTGAGIFAKTGLLDGKNATTNKQLFSVIASTFPTVNWQHKARWVVDGNFWTSSGVAAGMDMGHAFIANVFGEAAATLLAFNLEIVPNTDPSNDPYAV